jgi:hypothetical protein
MKKRVSVKRNLINFIKGLLFLSTLFVFSCVKGGGDAYTSKVYSGDKYAFVQVSTDRKNVRIGGNELFSVIKGSVSKYGENFISIAKGGRSIVGFKICSETHNYLARKEYALEIKNGYYRVGVCYRRRGWYWPCWRAKDTDYPSCTDNYYKWSAWKPFCTGTASLQFPGTFLYLDVKNGYVRVHYDDRTYRAYGNWVKFICISCPQNYTYNPSRNVCEAQPTFTCPYTGKACLKSTDGKYYCSPYDCHNVVTTPTQITDTPMGINDKENDAPVTSKGCLGNVYVFNGRDMRCRPPGVQTGFSNCCKKTSTWFGLGQCTQTEKELSTLRNWGRLDGSCHYVGEYCTEKWLGVCVQKKKTYCCYSSPLARIIVEAAHKQLGIPWGSPESPNCRGLTPEEFQKLDFSKMDFSEWVDYQLKTEVLPAVNTSLSNAINDLKTSVQSSY